MENQKTENTSASAPNYTEADVQVIRDHAPLNKEIAEKVGALIGKSWRSVVAKAKREGIEYIAMQPEPKKGRDAPTKAQLAEQLRELTGFKLPQVDKASVRDLTELLTFAQSVTAD